MCTTGHIPPETSSRYGVSRCPQYVKYTRPLAGCPGGGGVPSVLSQPIPATSPTAESRKSTHFSILLSSELLICNPVTEGLSYKIVALRVMASECESCGVTSRQQGQVFGCHSETNGPFPTAKIILTFNPSSSKAGPHRSMQSQKAPLHSPGERVTSRRTLFHCSRLEPL